MKFMAMPAAFFAGMMTTFQSGMTSRTREGLGEPGWALLFNFLMGLAGIATYLLVLRPAFPAPERFAGVPWWAWISGLVGVTYGFIVVLVAKPLGAATLTALTVTGQLTISLILDHYGVVGFDQHTLSIQRVLGWGLMAGGLTLIARY